MKDKSGGMSDMIKPIAIGVLSSCAVTALLMFIFAAILAKIGAADSVIVSMSMVSLAVGSFIGGFVGSKICGKNGLAVGALCGIILFFAITLLALILSASGLTVQSVIRLALIMICSSIGGITGVNVKRKSKII